MRSFSAFTASAALALLCQVSAAQTLEQLDQVEHANKALDALQTLQAQVDARQRSSNLDCLKAFGNAAFCTCLSANLPFRWSVVDYVIIVTRSKGENGYARLSPEDKRAYDAVPAVREKCLASTRAP